MLLFILKKRIFGIQPNGSTLKNFFSLILAILNLTPLTKKAVYAKPVEQQSVPLVLKEFCDETIAGLRIKFKAEAENTILFLQIV